MFSIHELYDLIAAAACLLIAVAVIGLEIGGIPRLVVAAVLVFFLPGYLTVAVLFPWRDHSIPRPRSEAGTRISMAERAALSFGLSIALLPLFGLALGTVTSGFSLTGVLAILSGYVVLAGSVAVYRRFELPPQERFVLPVERWLAELSAGLTTGPRLNRLLTISLVCSIVVAVGAFGFAAGTTVGGETYTDFHVVTEQDGEYVSADYPDQLVRGEAAELTWGVHNFERTETRYTVVVALERVAQDDAELTRIESVELDRQSVTVDDRDRAYHDHTVEPTLIGEDLRLSYYLYQGDAPETPDSETAYRHVHIWVDVSPET